MNTQKTPMHNMRKFHNYIKKKILDEVVSLDDTSNKTLLDLASGKGGDLQKWNQNKNISSVVGYDINETSVKEAIKRRNQMKIKKNIKFFVKDLSSNILNCDSKFDIITSMFAFHYFFKNKKTLDTILSTIDNCSHKGTYLILVLFDGSRVKTIDTDDFYIHVDDKSNDNRKKYNRNIDVYIKDSVLDKPETEYIVDSKFLIKKLKSISFDLVKKENFEQLYEDCFGLSNNEKKLSFVNTVYIFKKTKQ